MGCHYCGTEEDTRPYGPGGSQICHPCATAPEHSEETLANFLAQLDAAAAMSPYNAVMLNFDNGGPEPLTDLDKE